MSFAGRESLGARYILAFSYIGLTGGGVSGIMLCCLGPVFGYFFQEPFVFALV